MKMIDDTFVPSRRTIVKQGVAVAVGAIAAGALSDIHPARAAKATQAAAMYQDKPHADQQCDRCSHYIPGSTATANGTCQVVDGSISPHGWCMLFGAKA